MNNITETRWSSHSWMEWFSLHSIKRLNFSVQRCPVWGLNVIFFWVKVISSNGLTFHLSFPWQVTPIDGAEVKTPVSWEPGAIKGYPCEAWSRSEYSLACFPYCLDVFILSAFAFPIPSAPFFPSHNVFETYGDLDIYLWADDLCFAPVWRSLKSVCVWDAEHQFPL